MILTQAGGLGFVRAPLWGSIYGPLRIQLVCLIQICYNKLTMKALREAAPDTAKRAKGSVGLVLGRGGEGRLVICWRLRTQPSGLRRARKGVRPNCSHPTMLLIIQHVSGIHRVSSRKSLLKLKDLARKEKWARKKNIR